MQTIGVFFGSRSTEHDISVITAQLIISGLKGLGYPVVPIYISKKGEWFIGEELGVLKNFTDPESKVLENNRFKQYYLDLEKSFGKLVLKGKGVLAKELVIDIAFPALHGSFGEDGTIQGLFEMLNVPFVGCGVDASAIAMDKALTKMICQQEGIPTTKFIHFYKRDWELDKAKITEQIKSELKWPVFVKPVHMGSSIGIAKVKEKEGKDLEHKIEVALHYDDKVLVEEAVTPMMDVTCCLIGNEEPVASELQESVFSSDLFDFEEKYLKDGGAQLGSAESGLVIPARLDEKTTNGIKDTAKRVYRALGCTGIARVDFLYNTETHQFFANEVNPLPGTVYHHLWKASGLELDKLLKELLHFAEERHAHKQKISYVFESSVLKQLHGKKLGGKKLKR